MKNLLCLSRSFHEILLQKREHDRFREHDSY